MIPPRRSLPCLQQPRGSDSWRAPPHACGSPVAAAFASAREHRSRSTAPAGNGWRSRDRAPPACQVILGARDRLRGWGERTRTRKCLFFVISAELLGFTQHFRTRDFSRTPGRDRFRSRRVKATFASSSPLCPARQCGLCGSCAVPKKTRGMRRPNRNCSTTYGTSCAR